MGFDLLTVGVGLLSFGVFLLVHVIVFRWVAPERLLKSLLGSVMTLMALPAIFMWILFLLKVGKETPQAWVCAGLLASLLQGLLCFFYVLCIFGPYETSVRMRLVREIASVPGGISGQELLRRYNDETIVNMRLRRLIGSGDIVEKNGFYRVVSKKNFFFIFDAIAGQIKKLIEKSV